MTRLSPHTGRVTHGAPRRAAALRISRTLGTAALLALATLAAATPGRAMAGPTLTLTEPTDGSISSVRAPTFTGATDDPFDPVSLKIYAGALGAAPVQTLSTMPSLGSTTWAAGATAPLPDGAYLAQAEQSEPAGEASLSQPMRFVVDGTPPLITLTSPVDGATAGESQVVAGAAGTAAGDLPTVTIDLFSQSSPEPGAVVESLLVQAAQGGWSGVFGGLKPGTYSVRARQSDTAGNTGESAPVTFTVRTPPSPQPPPPPLASFRWFPSHPRTGEVVSLVSSSTDPASPLASFAWALTGGLAFQPGEPVISVAFPNPGGHVVRLRVTDAAGAVAVASETITVTRPPLSFMLPFPVVRLAGAQTSTGVRVSLLSVLAPAGARVTVACRGQGCPTRFESRVAAARSGRGRPGAVQISFARFERALRNGVVLEIRVSKPGTVGKYTRFVIRRGKLPSRLDTCLGSTDPKPMACPS